MDTLNASPDIKAETKVQMLASLADSCNKTVAASRQVLPEASQLHHDGRGAAGWLHTREVPETRPSFVEVLEPFEEELAKAYG